MPPALHEPVTPDANIDLLEVYEGTSISSTLRMLAERRDDEVLVLMRDGSGIVVPRWALHDAKDPNGSMGSAASAWERR